MSWLEHDASCKARQLQGEQSPASYGTLKAAITRSLLLQSCSLLTAHCSLLTAHCSLLTAHCSLLTAHCSLLTAHCSLLTAHCSLTAAVVSVGKKPFYQSSKNHAALDVSSHSCLSRLSGRAQFSMQASTRYWSHEANLPRTATDYALRALLLELSCLRCWNRAPHAVRPMSRAPCCRCKYRIPICSHTATAQCRF